MKIQAPKFDIIEEMALKFAATYFEVARTQGLKPRNARHRTPRLWALHNFEKFIPKAVEIAIEMLGRNDVAEPIKEKVYLAIMERTNDPELQKIFPIDTLPDININLLLEPKTLVPVIVNTKRYEGDYKNGKKDQAAN